MLQIRRDIAELLSKIEKEIDFDNKLLIGKPTGRLTCMNQHGQIKFVWVHYDNNNRVRENLSLDNPLLPALIKRYLAERELAQLRENLSLLKTMESKVKDFDLNYEIYEYKKALPLLNDDLIAKALAFEKDDSWANAPYEKYQYQDNRTKWHMSTFGMRFRSKSELLIAEMLHKYEIPFHYEEVLYCKGTTLAPDFTIRRHDGKFFYWEHEGLTNSEKYVGRQIKKHQIYAMNNIVPWDNFIVTYDNADGIIDLRIVESEITNKLLNS